MVKTAGLTFASRLTGAMLSFGLIILISQWLGSQVRGVCGFYLVIIATTTAISDIAGGATVPFLIRYFPASRLLRGQMGWAIIPAFLVPLSFFFLSAISVTEFLLLAVAGWLNSTWSVQQQLLLGFKKFAAFNLMTIAIPTFSIAGFVVFYVAGFRSSLSYLTAIGLAFLMATLSGFFLLGNAIENQSLNMPRQKSRVIFQKGLQNQLAHLASLLNSRLIFFVMPAASLGLWSNTLTMAEAFFLIPGSLGQVAYGLVAGKNKLEDKKNVFQKAWWTNLTVLIPCLLIALLIPDRFWQWLFGDDFTGIAGLLKLTIPGIGLYSLYLLVSYRQSASGNFKYNFYAVMAGLTINLVATGIMLLSGNYTLTGGIMALVLGWGIASAVALSGLHRTNPIAFQSFFRLPFHK